MIAAVVVAAAVVAGAPDVGLAGLSTAEILQKEQAAAAALGTYRMLFTKQERIDGALQKEQEMELLVRPAPFAVVAEVKRGEHVGRRFLYSAALNETQLRVRESGVLGVVGGVWIDVDSPWTRDDTRHPVTNLGFAPLLHHIAEDQQRGAAAGGHARVDEGFDKDGSWCMRFEAPPGVKGLYAKTSLLCVDPQTFLLTRAEISDDKGVFERLRFRVLARNLELDDSAFSLEANGL